MTLVTDQRAEFARTPQVIATLGVRYCANFYATSVIGARGGEQGLRHTEEFNDALWIKTNVTVTADTFVAPDGTTTADTLDYTAATGNILMTSDFSITAATGDGYTGPVWLRTAAGTGTITLRISKSAGVEETDALVTVTTTWTRFSVAAIAASNGGSWRFAIHRVAGDLVQVIAWGANMSRIQASYPPPAGGHVFPYRKRVAEGVQTSSVMASPCTGTANADAGDGLRCFYSFPTCQDTANFNSGNSYEATPALRGIREYRFCMKDAPLPLLGEEIRPYIIGLDWAAQKIDPEHAVTVNERVSLKFEDDNLPGLWDPVKSTDGAKVNTQLEVGSFWRRWLAIFKNYANPDCYAIVKRGFVASGITEALYEQRGRYLMRNLEIDSGGGVMVTCADRLKLLFEKGPPKISTTNLLNGGITSGATSISVNDASEITAPPADGSFSVVIQIDNEKMNVTAKTNGGNPLTVQRGRWGTNAAAHNHATAFTELMEFGTERTTPSLTPLPINPMDAVVQVLLRGGIALADIDTVKLYSERDTWTPSTIDTATGVVTGTLVRRTVSDPEQFQTLLTELCELLMLSLLTGEDQKVTGRLFNPALPTETLAELTDDANFLADSISVDDNDESRVTRVVVAYDLIAGQKGDTEGDYAAGQMAVEPELESSAGYGRKILKAILSKWVRSSDSRFASRAAGRYLSRFRNGARKVSGSVELKDDGNKCGDFVLVTTAMLQKASGATDIGRQMQIVKKEPKDDGTIELGLLDAILPGRFGFIAPAGYPDWDAATAAQQRYCYIGSAVSNKLGTAQVGGFLIY